MRFTFWCREQYYCSQGDQVNAAAGGETRPHLQSDPGFQLEVPLVLSYPTGLSLSMNEAERCELLYCSFIQKEEAWLLWAMLLGWKYPCFSHEKTWTDSHTCRGWPVCPYMSRIHTTIWRRHQNDSVLKPKKAVLGNKNFFPLIRMHCASTGATPGNISLLLYAFSPVIVMTRGVMILVDGPSVQFLWKSQNTLVFLKHTFVYFYSF